MKEPEIDLLWRLGIEPRLTGYQYYLDAFEKIKAGMKIDPLLLRKIAAEHNTDYRNIYNAMRTAQQFSQRKKAIIYEEFMGNGAEVYTNFYIRSCEKQRLKST